MCWKMISFFKQVNISGFDVTVARVWTRRPWEIHELPIKRMRGQGLLAIAVAAWFATSSTLVCLWKIGKLKSRKGKALNQNI